MKCELALATTMLTAQIMSKSPFPEPDEHGRRKTLNNHGYGDSVLSAIAKEFIEKATELTSSKPLPNELPNIALDLGGGFGDVSRPIIEAGGKVAYIDMEPQHGAMMREWYEMEREREGPDPAKITNLGLLEIITAKLPFREARFDLGSRKLQELKKKYKIAVMGSFSMIMYLNGLEQLEFLTWSFKNLPEGGKLIISGISPHCNLFPGYEPVYLEKLGAFRKNPTMSFPGFVDARKPEMAPYLPENYLEMYPPTFHFTIPEVMDYYAQKIGFEVEKSGFLRRTYPERLRYLGSLPDVGEIAYGVYVKPKTPQFTLE